MATRRRLATREEFIEILSGREPAVDWAAVLDQLEAAGAAVMSPEVVVDEEA